MKIAIIPARGGSKRIKNKNIIDFCGKPMISYSLDAAKKSGIFDKIHVSTDSDEIQEVCEALGYSVDFKRAASLADDFTGIVPVIKWVLDEYKKRGEEYTEICIILPTAPLINESDLEEAYKLFEKHDKDFTTMSCGTFPVPSQWALKKLENGLVTPLNPEALEVRSQDLEEYYFDSGSFYFLTPKNLESTVGINTVPYLLSKEKCIDIDSASDLVIAEALFKVINKEQE